MDGIDHISIHFPFAPCLSSIPLSFESYPLQICSLDWLSSIPALGKLQIVFFLILSQTKTSFSNKQSVNPSVLGATCPIFMTISLYKGINFFLTLNMTGII